MTPIRRSVLLVLIVSIVALVAAAAAPAAPLKEKKAKLAAVQAKLATVYEQSDVAVERYNAAAARLKDVQARVKHCLLRVPVQDIAAIKGKQHAQLVRVAVAVAQQVQGLPEKNQPAQVHNLWLAWDDDVRCRGEAVDHQEP